MLNVVTMERVIINQSKYYRYRCYVYIHIFCRLTIILYIRNYSKFYRYCASRTACATVHLPSLACSASPKEGLGTKACKNACETFSCCWKEGGCYSTHEEQCLNDTVNCDFQ